MRTAIIGGGVAGLVAAWALCRRHEVMLFEAAPAVGGHTATIDVQTGAGTLAVDTGFIVYNDRTYPHFIRLMDELGVASQPTQMSFSVSDDVSGLEYAGTSLDTVFAQRGNLLRPRFWRMLRDILRFNREALGDVEAGNFAGLTLGEYLDRRGYSSQFREHYLIPMGAAIWSSGTAAMRDFPLEFFVRFFHNHGLLTVSDQPQWRTLVGGSRAYLGPLTAPYRERIRCGDPVVRVSRMDDGVRVQTRAGVDERFDHVVFACHADQALALLADPSRTEQDLLGALPYRDNEVVLHTDTRLLPRNRRTWSSWNYRLRPGGSERPTLSYNMNILQRLPGDTVYCVTLNDGGAIDPARVIGRYTYAHPVFTAAGSQAQARLHEISGVRRTSYCGAWCANGFHEDGVRSALDVAARLGAPW